MERAIQAIYDLIEQWVSGNFVRNGYFKAIMNTVPLGGRISCIVGNVPIEFTLAAWDSAGGTIKGIGLAKYVSQLNPDNLVDKEIEIYLHISDITVLTILDPVNKGENIERAN